MKIFLFIIHFIIIGFLTIVTQVGGVIWAINLCIRRYLPKKRRNVYNFLSFLLLYTISTFIIIPKIASQFGRTPLPISKSTSLAPHNFMTVFLNRHYVRPALKKELIEITNQFQQSNPGIKVVYLDANFPFWNGFPLLPHLSHNDGRKIDLSFIYSRNGILTNEKPARSGYGFYEKPTKGESNQPKNCLEKGYWQYDFPKYLTLGSTKKLQFEPTKTKELIQLILRRKKTQKVFIEPHLKSRMKINHNKLRYHGCKAVRHDDHIHYQIK